MLLSRKSVQILNVNDLHQCWVFDDTYHNCIAEIRKCAAHEQNTKFADKSSSQSSLSFSYCAIDPMYQRIYSFFRIFESLTNCQWRMPKDQLKGHSTKKQIRLKYFQETREREKVCDVIVRVNMCVHVQMKYIVH